MHTAERGRAAVRSKHSHLMEAKSTLCSLETAMPQSQHCMCPASNASLSRHLSAAVCFSYTRLKVVRMGSIVCCSACRLERLLALERSMDTVVWQLLASVICPGYTIHTVVALAHAGLIPLEVSRTTQQPAVCITCFVGYLVPVHLLVFGKAAMVHTICWHCLQEQKHLSIAYTLIMFSSAMQQMEPVKEAVNALAITLSLQGDVLMSLIDKSLPTATGLAGGSLLLDLLLKQLFHHLPLTNFVRFEVHVSTYAAACLRSPLAL